MGGDEVFCERPVEGFASPAVVLSCGSVDEESEVFRGKFGGGKVFGGDRTDDGNAFVEKMADVISGLIAVELDDVDEIFFDEFVGERNGIIDEHADTQNFPLEWSEEFLREFGRVVAF